MTQVEKDRLIIRGYLQGTIKSALSIHLAEN